MVLFQGRAGAGAEGGEKRERKSVFARLQGVLNCLGWTLQWVSYGLGIPPERPGLAPTPMGGARARAAFTMGNGRVVWASGGVNGGR
jgi:hypothetical protein